MIRRIVPILRRCVQALSLAALALLPVFALYTHHKAAHSMHDLEAETWQLGAVKEVDRFVGDSTVRRDLVENTYGTMWSARIAGVTLTDPLAGAEAIVSSRSFYGPMLWSLAIPLAVTVLLGRVFCGWVCPMNTLLEIVDRGRKLMRFAEIRERDVRFSLKNKYIVLALVLGWVGLAAAPTVALFYPPAVLSREMHLIVFGAAVGVGAYLIVAICAIELFISKRWWCRYVCPGGALYSLLGRFRIVRVVRNESNCVQCGDCVRVCQFGLRPMHVHMTGMECTNCGSCVRACNDDALHFQLVPLHKEFQKTQPAAKPASDSGLPKLTVLGAIALAVLLPVRAEAHHLLGLPHYSYKENYPQAPTLEYPATTGPYDVLMTSFPGRPVPGERTAIAFYIKDRNTGLPYDRPVTVRVLQTATFGENQVIMEAAELAPSTNQHKCFLTFPQDGEFIAELTLEVEGQTEVIPFLMTAGEPSAARSIVIAAIAALAVFLLAVRAVRIKRGRRVRSTAASNLKGAAV